MELSTRTRVGWRILDSAGEMMEALERRSLKHLPSGGLSPLVEAMMRPRSIRIRPPTSNSSRPTFLIVFIAGDFVYKVKKPVHFAFLDCSQLAQRFHYCREEVRLNARLSPRVYLGVFAILQDAESFVLGPLVAEEHPGAVEYAVKMRRLPEDRMLDQLIASGHADSGSIGAIARRIAEFHAMAPSNRGWTYGSAAAVLRNIIEEIAQNKVSSVTPLAKTSSRR